MTFTGAATVSAANAGTNVSVIDGNTIEFDCDWNGNKWLSFSGITGPLAVSIVKTDLLSSHASGVLIDPVYISGIPSGGCLRFMDWMETNNSSVVATDDYPTTAHQTWTRAPWAAITEICNRTDSDAWCNIPHQANDVFVEDFCEYFRDNLDGKLRLELSNEIWNTGVFTQGAYFRDQAQSVWGVANGFSNGYYLAYAGKRFVECVNIAKTVFSAQPSRLIAVLGAQAANAAVATTIADALAWQTFEPGSYVPPHILADEIGIAPYINWAGDITAKGNTIAAALAVSSANGVQAIKDMIPASLAQSKEWIAAHVPICADRQCRMVSYEYNTHYDLQATSSSSLYSGGSPVAGALDIFIEAAYSSEMATAQNDLRSHWKAQSGSLAAFFVLESRASRFGTWGARTHAGHDSTIYSSLLAWHTANPRWWSQ